MPHPKLPPKMKEKKNEKTNLQQAAQDRLVAMNPKGKVMKKK